jgi:hypothetical protein
MTRKFASWNKLPHINLRRKEYVDMYNLNDTFVSPWGSEIPLDGTDGI